MKIIAILPNAGLANKLLIWSEAVCFAKSKGIDYSYIIVYPWVDFHPLRLLRFDKDQRIYFDFFKSSDFISRIMARFYMNRNLKIEYALFDEIPDSKDYFKNLRGNEEIVKSAFFNYIKPKHLIKSNDFPEYDVAIHVRRGDFPVNLLVSDDTILEFIESITKKFHNKLKINLFSDATSFQLERILKSSNNINLIKGNSPIVDLLLMSKAKIVVPSIRSTFSYFACYISDAVIVRHRNDTFGKIKIEKEYWLDEFLSKDIKFINSLINLD